MTEIAWLVQFMFAHKLPIKAKDDIVARIGEVESLLSSKQGPQARPVNVGIQAASTQRILDEAAQEGVIIAATQATAQALAARQQAINIATSGKPEAGRTSPRKF